MGGRGSVSGKTKSVGTTTSVKTKGNKKEIATKSVGINIKSFTPTKTPVSKMSDKRLREELAKAAGHYYASGKSGISFGNRDPYQVASVMANQKMSRSRMEKEYKSIMKRLKK